MNNFAEHLMDSPETEFNFAAFSKNRKKNVTEVGFPGEDSQSSIQATVAPRKKQRIHMNENLKKPEFRPILDFIFQNYSQMSIIDLLADINEKTSPVVINENDIASVIRAVKKEVKASLDSGKISSEKADYILKKKLRAYREKKPAAPKNPETNKFKEWIHEAVTSYEI